MEAIGMSALLILLAVIAIGVITAYWFPTKTQRLVQRILFARRIIFGVGAIIVAFVFIGTGNAYLVLLGGFTFLIMVWVGFFEIRGDGVF